MAARSSEPVILVIEDDPDLCALVELALASLGLVTTANSVASARLAAATEPPDMVILDVMLPDGNGLALVHELQETQTVHVPVLILTGLGSGDEKVRGFDAGADDYLIKPFDLDELRVRVRALLRMRQVEKDLAARNRSLQEANQAATILLDTAQALTALGDQLTVLQESLNLLSRLFQADRAAIWLSATEQDPGRVWGVEVTRGKAPRRVGRRLQPPYVSLPDQHGGLLVVEDVRDADHRLEAIGSDGLRALIAASIRRGEQHLGTLMIGFEKPQAFSTQTVDVVRGLGNQLAIAIENARLYEQLQEAALTDSSTGLRNMRFFQSALEVELSRTVRRHRDQGVSEPFSVLMMDLNKFKQYNDSYGHPVGDEALRRFGELVQGGLRRYDTLARYGGDEFIVLLPSAGSNAAHNLADRLRRRVMAADVRLGEGINVRFSCSVGVATYPVDGATANELVRAADDALYAAKRREADGPGPTAGT